MKKTFTKFMLLLCALVVGSGNVWATAYISYNVNTQDASTTISGSNVSSGSAGKISWTGSSCTYSSRVNIAANGSITFTANSGYKITKIVLYTTTSNSYYGTWSSTPSVSPTGQNTQTVTFDGLSSNSVTITTTTAYRCTNAGSIKIYYEEASEAPSITFNDGNVRVGRKLDLSTRFTSNSAGAVTYSITAGGSYANLVGSTLTGVAEGSVTVKAAQEAAGIYSAGEATATITVNAALTLSSIAITTDPTKTTYTEGETFDPSGMVVTATYSDDSTEDVTALCTYSPTAALTTSDTEITISYTENAVEKTTTQAITVNPLPKYTVTFSDGGSVTQASYSAAVTLPSRSTIGSYTFAGWSATNVAPETTAVPAIIPAGSYTPAADIMLYPVYRRVVSGVSQNKTASISISDYASAHSWNNGEQYETVTLDENVTATATGTTNTGKYYSNDNSWRIYNSEGGYLTISVSNGGSLTSATISFGNSTLSYDDDDITSGTAVSLSESSASFYAGGKTYIFSISVDYNVPFTTYYNSGYSMSISKWTDEDTSDGWYLIAAPVGTTAAASIGNLTSNSYDLFRFNQAVENEWENYNDDTHGHNHFALEPGRGYLYANSNDVTLTFFDQSTSNSNDVTLTYSGANTNPKMRGWNLIGNPFATTATIKDSDINAKPFYRMNNTHTDLIPETTTGNVNPMEGIFVHTTTNNEVVTFTKTATRATESNDNLVVIDLSAEKGNVIDRAIVRFDEGETLPKFQLKDNSTKLYIQQGGKDYAIAFAYRMGMLPLNFKAEKTGKYTLGFSGENMNGVKLIDKIANVTVDLGIENEYSFIGMPNDREDRFALVFSSASSETSHDVFAYQNGNEIVVNGEGILEVFDVTGRKVMITTINGVQTLNSLNTGFYIFRLNEKTQKIVVR